MLNSFVFVSSGWIVYPILSLKLRGWFESVNRADGCFCSVFWRVERFSSFLISLCWILTIKVSWRAGCWIALSLSQVAELSISIPTLPEARGRFESESWTFQLCPSLGWILTINVSLRAGCWRWYQHTGLLDSTRTVSHACKYREHIIIVLCKNHCCKSISWTKERFII